MRLFHCFFVSPAKLGLSEPVLKSQERDRVKIREVQDECLLRCLFSRVLFLLTEILRDRLFFCFFFWPTQPLVPETKEKDGTKIGSVCALAGAPDHTPEKGQQDQ